MKSNKLQQLENEIMQEMIDGLQQKNFDKILENYGVSDKAKLKFQFTLNLDTIQLSETDESKKAEGIVLQGRGWCIPCPTNPFVNGCHCRS